MLHYLKNFDFKPHKMQKWGNTDVILNPVKTNEHYVTFMILWFDKKANEDLWFV